MSDDNLIGSDAPLSEAQRQTLKLLLGAMIPASDEYQVPGADDAQIMGEILADGRPVLPLLAGALDALAEETNPDALSAAFRRDYPEAADLLVWLTTQCYYRDERVMASLEMPPRPPFPEGYEVADGDWSLLEPVRARGLIYRKV